MLENRLLYKIIKLQNAVICSYSVQIDLIKKQTDFYLQLCSNFFKYLMLILEQKHIGVLSVPVEVTFKGLSDQQKM